MGNVIIFFVRCYRWYRSHRRKCFQIIRYLLWAGCLIGGIAWGIEANTIGLLVP